MYVSIKPSKQEGKKMTAIFYDNDKKKLKTINFGASGYQDYTKHHDDQRRDRYISRHKNREDWNNPMTAGSLSYHILWSRKTVKEGIKHFMDVFNLKKF